MRRAKDVRTTLRLTTPENDARRERGERGSRRGARGKGRQRWGHWGRSVDWCGPVRGTDAVAARKDDKAAVAASALVYQR